MAFEFGTLVGRRGRPCMIVTDDRTGVTYTVIRSRAAKQGVTNYRAAGKTVLEQICKKFQRSFARRAAQREIVL